MNAILTSVEEKFSAIFPNQGIKKTESDLKVTTDTPLRTEQVCGLADLSREFPNELAVKIARSGKGLTVRLIELKE